MRRCPDQPLVEMDERLVTGHVDEPQWSSLFALVHLASCIWSTISPWDIGLCHAYASRLDRLVKVRIRYDGKGAGAEKWWNSKRGVSTLWWWFHQSFRYDIENLFQLWKGTSPSVDLSYYSLLICQILYQFKINMIIFSFSEPTRILPSVIMPTFFRPRL